MDKVDKFEYLNHQFERIGINNYFTCQKCSIDCVYPPCTKYNDSIYYYFYNNERAGYEVLTLTCEEVIIKNIIE